MGAMARQTLPGKAEAIPPTVKPPEASANGGVGGFEASPRGK